MLHIAGHRATALTGAVFVALATALSGCQFGVINQGTQPPVDEDIYGPLPAPPPDYDLDHKPSKLVDVNNDGRKDRVYYTSDGRALAHGIDTDGDGRIDVYQRVENGVVIEETRDKNKDGTLDERATDKDRDGTLETVTPYAPPKP